MEGRERTRAKYSADLFARSSPLLLLRLMSSPSTPSPAVHPIARLCHRSGRGTGGHLVRFWTMSSPHLATTSPPIYQHQGSASTVCHPARLVPVLVLFLQVVMVGQSKRQTKQKEREQGRSIPPTSSPVPRLSFCSV